MAIIIAIGVNAGYREVIGAMEGMKEDKARLVDFFKYLKSRGLSDIKLVIGDNCFSMLESLGDVHPEDKYQRYIVYF